jgi:hypothetical protein
MQVGQSPVPTGSPIYNAYPYTGLAVVCANDDIDRYSSLISSRYAGVIVPTNTAANTIQTVLQGASTRVMPAITPPPAQLP